MGLMKAYVERGGVRQVNIVLDLTGGLGSLKSSLYHDTTVRSLSGCQPQSFLHDSLLQEVARTVGLLSHLCLRSLRV